MHRCGYYKLIPGDAGQKVRTCDMALQFVRKKLSGDGFGG
jgi:hypothetical protein